MRSIAANKNCESCGEPFGCGAKLDGCWCADVEMAPTVADDLKAKYQDCLCPKCLGALAAQPLILVTYPDGTTTTITEAVRVDAQNYHEGMFDFYDERGTLLEQIDMNTNISWEIVDPKNIEKKI